MSLYPDEEAEVKEVMPKVIWTQADLIANPMAFPLNLLIYTLTKDILQ